MTRKLCATARPSGSLAVTVTVASPCPTAVIASVPCAADTSSATTPLPDAWAPQVSSSPSGSVKNRARASVSASFLNSVRAGIVSATSGGRFGTVTAKRCSADSPSSSVAVTVTSASPLASADTTTVLSETDTETNALSDAAAA